MNHGYCENCWWWEPIRFNGSEWTLGVCWMWNNPQENDSYCPDYCNRKNTEKKDGTLEEWVKSLPSGYEFPEETKFKRI